MLHLDRNREEMGSLTWADNGCGINLRREKEDTGNVAQLLERSPNMHEAPGSNPNPP